MTGLTENIISINRDDIYTEYKSRIMGYLVNKLNNTDVAEDLCEDVFVKIYGKLETFDPSKASLSTWIYNITRNTLYDHFRTSHPHEELDEELPNNNYDILDEVCNSEMLHELYVALNDLDERDREIIIRHYYNNETLKDIAVIMQISYSYIKILHNNALIKLQKILSLT